MAKELKYGWVRGGELGTAVTVAASQVIRAASGKFVKRTSYTTPTVTLATSTDSDLLGGLECEELNSSDGTEVRKVINDHTAIFRMPINGGTYAVRMIGQVCDLSVSSNIQGACLDSSTMDVLEIVGGDAVDNYWVEVRLNNTVTTKRGVV